MTDCVRSASADARSSCTRCVVELAILQGAHGPEDRSERAEQRLSPELGATDEQFDVVVSVIQSAELDEGEDSGADGVQRDLISVFPDASATISLLMLSRSSASSGGLATMRRVKSTARQRVGITIESVYGSLADEIASNLAGPREPPGPGETRQEAGAEMLVRGSERGECLFEELDRRVAVGTAIPSRRQAGVFVPDRRPGQRLDVAATRRSRFAEGRHGGAGQTGAMLGVAECEKDGRPQADGRDGHRFDEAQRALQQRRSLPPAPAATPLDRRLGTRSPPRHRAMQGCPTQPSHGDAPRPATSRSSIHLPSSPARQRLARATRLAPAMAGVRRSPAATVRG